MSPRWPWSRRQPTPPLIRTVPAAPAAPAPAAPAPVAPEGPVAEPDAEGPVRRAASAETAHETPGAHGPDRRDPVEIELKYLVDDPAVAEAALAGGHLGPFEIGPAGPEIRVEDRYIDTADRALRAAGFVARLRHGETGVTLTVKSFAIRRGAEHRRLELEGPADATLDPAGWTASAARSTLLEHVGERALVELGRSRQLRRPYPLIADGTRVEATVDTVEVVVDDEVVDRFSELEAELRAGDETLLDALAAAISGLPGIAPAEESKMERALRVTALRRRVLEEAAAGERGGEGAPEPMVEAEEPTEPEVEAPTLEPIVAAWPAVEPAPADPFGLADLDDDLHGHEEPELHAAELAAAERAYAIGPLGPDGQQRFPGVLPEDSVGEAGRKVLRFHLDRMIAREAGTRLGEDPEELHKMRVATRRMRAAWRVFGDGFRGERTKRHRGHLRVIATRLGAVRDRDVLLEGLERYRATASERDREAIEPLADHWRTEREVARIELMEELDSERYLRWLEDFRAFAGSPGTALAPWRPATPHRVRDTSASRLWEAYEQIRAYEAVLRWADIATLHQLRIAAKRLRYTLEFLRETLPPEAGALVARLVALQDHLGELNDAAVAAGLTRAFLVEHADRLDEPTTLAIGRYLASREREMETLRRSVGAPWRGVAGLAFRRSLGRVAAAL